MENFSFIHGNYHQQSFAAELVVTHKFNGDVIGRIQQADEKALETAIASAHTAFKELQQWSPAQRIECMEKLIALMLVHKDHLAETICMEAGKPLFYAQQEVLRCIETIRAGIRETGNAMGEIVPMYDGQKLAFTKRFAYGPVLGITPFNFPLNLALHKIIPALAVGTSIVIKAAPQAPLSLLKLASLIHQAGAPVGAVNVLVCDLTLAEKLVRDNRFPVLSFTGSDRVGWYLKSIAGKKRVLLELGGNAPVIVDETANLDQAAAKIAYGAFLYAGQICISTQKIYVAQKVADTFTELLLAETESIKSGDPAHLDTINGPLIDAKALENAMNKLSEAKRAGAELLCGGFLINPESRILAPSLLSGVHPETSLQKDEVFAPIAILETVRNTEQAIKLANSSRFGLQCGVFCNDTELFKRAFDELQYGAVLLNSAPGFRVDHMPYGGIKDSGTGREGVRYTMLEYTESKLAVL